MSLDRISEGPWAYVLLALLAVALYLPGLVNLPATDRDEARFAQATRQMLETGDYLHIRFQDEARNKKPVGIHWLQAGSAAVFAGGDTGTLWAYRIPSLLGALAASLLLFGLTRPAIGPPAAFLAAVMLASSLLLGVEANIAKTDAMLLALVVAAQGSFLRLYVGARCAEPASLPLAAAFWAAMGAGILVKGPVVPFIAVLTVAALLIADRRAGIWTEFTRRLRPGPGVLIMLGIAAPWFVAVTITDSGFVAEAFREDLLPKLISGHESHGAPPGTYLALMPVTFWPAALMVPFGLLWAWINRRDPAARFALAWAIPSWIAFEAIPTKLAHYVLPLYPALALMAGAAIADPARPVVAWLRRLGARLWVAVWALAGLVLAALVPLIAWQIGGEIPISAWFATAGALGGVAVGVTAALRAHPVPAVIGPALAMVVLLPSTLGFALPAVSALWPAVEAKALVERHHMPGAPPVASTGYREPSLVFALGTDTVLALPEEAALRIAEVPAALVIVEQRDEAKFQAKLQDMNRTAEPLGQVEGFNIARGQRIALTLFRARTTGHTAEQ